MFDSRGSDGMDEKECTQCRLSKPVCEFYRRGAIYKSRCKECQREIAKWYYWNHRKKYLERSVWTRARLRQVVLAHKHRPCMDCGVMYGAHVMDFDHRPGEKKSFAISRATNVNVSCERLLEEIAKCDVVCANCHRERTHRRRVGA